MLLGLLGTPPLLLRALCVGHSCDEEASATQEGSFCSLPQALRSRISDGWREGRSPDVIAIAREESVIGGGSGFGGAKLRPPWPSANLDATRVPIVFSGEGVALSSIPRGTTLDGVAPTLADLIEFERPFPGVRSGRPIEGVANGEAPKLILQVVLKGVGSDELAGDRSAWPSLGSMMSSGASTMDGDTGSVPVDPAAIMSTVGTGGLPRQHGVTGTFLRNDAGEMVRAFSPRADVSIISTLSDDLDEAMAQEPLIGLVGTAASDVGAIGGDWYVGGDRDEVVIDPIDQVGPAVEMLSQGFGADEVVDVMTVALDGAIGRMDDALERIVTAATNMSDGSVAIAVVGTGSTTEDAVDGAVVASDVEEAVGVPVVEAAVPGGLFVDQKKLVKLELSEGLVIDELARLTGPEGRLFAEVLPAMAVSFARYC